MASNEKPKKEKKEGKEKNEALETLPKLTPAQEAKLHPDAPKRKAKEVQAKAEAEIAKVKAEGGDQETESELLNTETEAVAVEKVVDKAAALKAAEEELRESDAATAALTEKADALLKMLQNAKEEKGEPTPSTPKKSTSETPAQIETRVAGEYLLLSLKELGEKLTEVREGSYSDEEKDARYEVLIKLIAKKREVEQEQATQSPRMPIDPNQLVDEATRKRIARGEKEKAKQKEKEARVEAEKARIEKRNIALGELLEKAKVDADAEIKIREGANGAPLSDPEKNKIKLSTYKEARLAFDKKEKAEIMANSEGAKKYLLKTEKFLEENPRTKLALETLAVGSAIVGYGLASGDIKEIWQGGVRVAARVGTAVGINTALTSKRVMENASDWGNAFKKIGDKLRTGIKGVKEYFESKDSKEAEEVVPDVADTEEQKASWTQRLVAKINQVIEENKIIKENGKSVLVSGASVAGLIMIGSGGTMALIAGAGAAARLVIKVGTERHIKKLEETLLTAIDSKNQEEIEKIRKSISNAQALQKLLNISNTVTMGTLSLHEGVEMAREKMGAKLDQVGTATDTNTDATITDLEKRFDDQDLEKANKIKEIREQQEQSRAEFAKTHTSPVATPELKARLESEHEARVAQHQVDSDRVAFEKAQADLEAAQETNDSEKIEKAKDALKKAETQLDKSAEEAQKAVEEAAKKAVPSKPDATTQSVKITEAAVVHAADAKTGLGGGITYSIREQLRADEDLAKAYKVDMDRIGDDKYMAKVSRDIAVKTGYMEKVVDEDGNTKWKEVRVGGADKAAYVLSGTAEKPSVQEYEVNKDASGGWTGKISDEVHEDGYKFEGTKKVDLEKYEYADGQEHQYKPRHTTPYEGGYHGDAKTDRVIDREEDFAPDQEVMTDNKIDKEDDVPAETKKNRLEDVSTLPSKRDNSGYFSEQGNRDEVIRGKDTYADKDRVVVVDNRPRNINGELLDLNYGMLPPGELTWAELRGFSREEMPPEIRVIHDTHSPEQWRELSKDINKIGSERIQVWEDLADDVQKETRWQDVYRIEEAALNAEGMMNDHLSRIFDHSTRGYLHSGAWQDAQGENARDFIKKHVGESSDEGQLARYLNNLKEVSGESIGRHEKVGHFVREAHVEIAIKYEKGASHIYDKLHVPKEEAPAQVANDKKNTIESGPGTSGESKLVEDVKAVNKNLINYRDYKYDMSARASDVINMNVDTVSDEMKPVVAYADKLYDYEKSHPKAGLGAKPGETFKEYEDKIIKYAQKHHDLEDVTLTKKEMRGYKDDDKLEPATTSAGTATKAEKTDNLEPATGSVKKEVQGENNIEPATKSAQQQGNIPDSLEPATGSKKKE